MSAVFILSRAVVFRAIVDVGEEPFDFCIRVDVWYENVVFYIFAYVLVYLLDF